MSKRPLAVPVVSYAGTIFLSSFLLFQVQPMIAKVILPWFGGTAFVWTTCMLFFEVVLLAGYGYSHVVVRRLPVRTQILLHLSLLVLCLLFLPIAPSSGWKPAGGENPTLRILGLLGATIGLPYLLLSTTGPLLQAWYARASRGAVPYRLFALSNLASMLALISYPPLVEPYLSTRVQEWVWSTLFALFVLLCAWAGWSTARAGTGTAEQTATAETAPAPPPSWTERLLWVALAAAASILLLAITNYLCQDVASIPFLWVLPLSIYLLSFILCFDSSGWYLRRTFVLLSVAALGAMVYILGAGVDRPPFYITIALCLTAFFVFCMVCHGELARRKPDPRYLTSFYLMVAIGGAAGGVFVGVVAPYLFHTYAEFPAGLVFFSLLVAGLIVTDGGLRPRIVGWRETAAILVVVEVAFCALLIQGERNNVAGCILVKRNFYGELRVKDSIDQVDSWGSYRTLFHGAINHGDQWLSPRRRRQAGSYYCADSGVGMAINRNPSQPRRVGVIGLGTGTLAVWSRPGDYYRFYEINPLVVNIARHQFTYLSDSKANVDVVLGDARLSLEREADKSFDVLVMDAFTSDAIPVHLITREALQSYFRHLKPEGIVAVHISNRYLDLAPVLRETARALDKVALLVDRDDEDATCFATTWVLLANNIAAFADGQITAAGTALPTKAGVSMWTDDYSNLFRILK